MRLFMSEGIYLRTGDTYGIYMSPPVPRNVKRTVYVTPEQAKWLAEHKEFNISGWLRPRLNKIMEDYSFLSEV